MSSLLLIPLCLWLLWAGANLAGAGYAAALVFMSDPPNLALTLLLAAVSLYHTATGVQVVIEDYVPRAALAAALLWFTRIACWLGFVAVVVALHCVYMDAAAGAGL